MNKLTIVLSIVLIIGSTQAATWAVLVAGSNGFPNYRQQSDVCHAYKTIVAGGLNPSNIIVFAYDDIANNTKNPIKGKIFNIPYGDDVYGSCVIDYKGEDVTPTNFLSVLKQDSSAMSAIGSGRVLKSNSNDKVLIFYSGLGARGLVSFPSKYLYANQLSAVLKGMWTNKQYQELVFYLEASSSGSMFEGYPTDQKLYALTSTNSNEPSYASYCPPTDYVDSKEIGSCLGNLFSTNWLETTDTYDMTKQTINQQYNMIKTDTDVSHVTQHGDLSFIDESVSNFVGKGRSPTNQKSRQRGSLINSGDLKLMYLINRHSKLLSAQSQNELNEEITSRKRYDDTFKKIKEIVGSLPLADSTDFDCYKDMVDTYEAVCGKTSDYGLKYFSLFYEICNCPTCNKIAVKSSFTKSCISLASA